MLDPTQLDLQLNARMDLLRKQVAARLCLCNWRRVRPDLLIDCSHDEIEHDVDACISKIRNPQGRLDFWQRYLDVNRFLFQLNAHLFSEAYKQNFATISEQFAQLTSQQFESYQLASQSLESMIEILDLTKMLEAKLTELSGRLTPFQEFSTHILELLQKAQGVLDQLRTTSKDMEDTFSLFLLGSIFFCGYLVLHLSTAFIFGGTSVYQWLRFNLFVLFLMDWTLLYPNLVASICFIAFSLPLATIQSLTSFYYRNRRNANNVRAYEASKKQSADEERKLEEWLWSFIERHVDDTTQIDELQAQMNPVEYNDNLALPRQTGAGVPDEDDMRHMKQEPRRDHERTRSSGLQSPKGRRSGPKSS